MKKAFVISGIACLAVGVAVLVLLSVLWSSGPDAGFAVGDMDRHFLEEMIPHHQMGVMMARMVLSRTDRPQVEELARSIIRTQTDEIEQMRAWFRAWYE